MADCERMDINIAEPKHAGMVNVDYVRAYGKIALKEIRHGNFTNIEQAISLLDDESEGTHSAVMRSLAWAFRSAHETGNQEVMDKILPFLVLEAL